MSNGNPQEQLARIITGYWKSQAIYAAAKLGIADLLKSGPLSVEHMAQRVSADPDALYRLLRALASIGIFAEGESQQFTLTPLAQLLRSDVDGSQRALALMTGDEQFQAWGEIVFSIQTGKTAFEKVFGQPIFEYLSANPEKGRVFDDAMTGIHGRESDPVLDAYDFSDIRVLAEIGGGNGSKLATILRKYPLMRGMLFDLPQVIDRVKEDPKDSDWLNRCELIGGDFFESVPAGADGFIMRHIIHDWDDEKALTILRNCHKVMPAGGKLLTVESVIPEGNEPFEAKFLDLVMLLIPGGRERTAEEYRTLYEQAGFELLRIVPTNVSVSVVEGVRR